MDLSRVIVYFLTHLITLDFNSAESGDSDAGLQDVAASDETTTPYIPERFTWAFLKAASGATVSDLRGQVSALTDDDDDDPQARVVYWIPSACDSLYERGYTCSGCGESLHCMAGNFGLRAICYGRRPYCNNGVCSFIPGEKCKKEGQVTHTADLVIQPVQPTADQAIQPIQETNIVPIYSPDPTVQDLSANVTLIADEIEGTIPIDSAINN